MSTKKERKTLAKGNKSILKEARAVSKQTVSRPMAPQMASIADPLTRQQLAILEYLYTLGHPWTVEPSGLPLVLGLGALRTQKAQVKFAVDAYCGTDGFGFVAVCLDGWYNTTSDIDSQWTCAAYNGGTQGKPIWSSAAGSSYGASGIPPAGTAASAGFVGTSMVLLDPQLTSTTFMRLVAAGIRGYNTAPANTASGKMAIVSTSLPASGAGLGRITQETFSTISSYPSDICAFESRAIPGMNSDHVMSVYAVPPYDTCFEMYLPPATGRATSGQPQIALLVSGGASGQSFTAEIVLDYEFQVGVTHATGIPTDPVIGVGKESIGAALNTMPRDAQVGRREDLSHAGSAGFVNYLAQTAPEKIRALNRPQGVISSLAQSALGSFVGKGMTIVKNILHASPFGRLASTGLSLLSKLF